MKIQHPVRRPNQWAISLVLFSLVTSQSLRAEHGGFGNGANGGFGGFQNGGGFNGFQNGGGGGGFGGGMGGGMGGGGGGGQAQPSQVFSQAMDEMKKGTAEAKAAMKESLDKVTKTGQESLQTLYQTTSKGPELPDMSKTIAAAATPPDRTQFDTDLTAANGELIKSISNVGNALASGIQARSPKAPEPAAPVPRETIADQLNHLAARNGNPLGSIMGANVPNGVTPPRIVGGSGDSLSGNTHGLGIRGIASVNSAPVSDLKVMEANTYAFPGQRVLNTNSRALQRR